MEVVEGVNEARRGTDISVSRRGLPKRMKIGEGSRTIACEKKYKQTPSKMSQERVTDRTSDVSDSCVFCINKMQSRHKIAKSHIVVIRWYVDHERQIIRGARG
jgi:hypothetical protein